MGARYSLAVGLCAGTLHMYVWPSGYLTVMGETHNHILVPGTSLFLIVITILSVPNHSIQRKTHRPKAPITSVPSLGLDPKHWTTAQTPPTERRWAASKVWHRGGKEGLPQIRSRSKALVCVCLSAWTSFPPTATATA